MLLGFFVVVFLVALWVGAYRSSAPKALIGVGAIFVFAVGLSIVFSIWHRDYDYISQNHELRGEFFDFAVSMLVLFAAPIFGILLNLLLHRPIIQMLGLRWGEKGDLPAGNGA